MTSEWDDAYENDLTPIADEHLEIGTLKERGRDGLDFHTVSVWGVRKALMAAFELGFQAGKDDT